MEVSWVWANIMAPAVSPSSDCMQAGRLLLLRCLCFSTNADFEETWFQIILKTLFCFVQHKQLPSLSVCLSDIHGLCHKENVVRNLLREQAAPSNCCLCYPTVRSLHCFLSLIAAHSTSAHSFALIGRWWRRTIVNTGDLARNLPWAFHDSGCWRSQLDPHKPVDRSSWSSRWPPTRTSTNLITAREWVVKTSFQRCVQVLETSDTKERRHEKISLSTPARSQEELSAGANVQGLLKLHQHHLPSMRVVVAAATAPARDMLQFPWNRHVHFWEWKTNCQLLSSMVLSAVLVT